MNQRLSFRTGFVVVSVLVVVAWGALAFGANYPWAYSPLLLAAAVTGLLGLLWGQGAYPRAVAAGLALIALAGVVQLVPVTPSLLQAVSPATHRFLIEYDFSYASGAAGHLSINPPSTVLGLAFLIAYGTLALGLARLLTRSSARAVAEGIVLVGYVVGFLGVMHRATYNGRIYGFWEPLMAGADSFGPFVNKNHFAGWMLMALPVAFGLLLAQASSGVPERASVRQKLSWLLSEQAGKTMVVGFGVFIMGLSLVLSMSRSGMLAAAMALAVTLVIAVLPRLSGVRRVVMVGAAIGTVVVIAALAGTARIESRFTVDTSTLAGRVPIWNDGARIASDFPLTGTGLNTFGTATLLYQESVPGLHLREAHNDYLQLAAEGGLLLGLPILFTVAAFIRGARGHLARSDGSSYWVRVGALTGMGAIALQSVFEFSLQMPGNAALFAVLCGLALHGGQQSTTRPVAVRRPA